MTKYIKAIFIYARKYKLLFIIAEICILITYSISLLLPLNLTKLVDQVIGAGKHYLFINVIISYSVLFLVFILVNMIYAYVWQKLYNNFVVDIKCDVYASVIKSKSNILSNMNSGDIMSRIDWDCDQFIFAVQRNLFHFLNSILLCAGIVVVIAKIDKYIAGLSIIAAILPILYTRFCGRFNEKYSQLNRNASGAFCGKTFEFIKGIRELKLNSSYTWASNQLKDFIVQLINLGNKIRKVDFLVNKGVYLINLLTSIAIYILSVNMIINNKMTIGSFLAIISYVALLHKKFNWVLRIYVDWKGRKTSIDRVCDVLSYEKESILGKKINDIKNIKFSNVVFGYENNTVLDKVSFDIIKGDKVAIVGVSGIGKSTIINLILGLYNANKGNICINGINIKNLNPMSIRQICSVVSQDVVLFEDTIRFNISIGNGVSDNEIYKVLRTVELYDTIINLPDKLDTEIKNGFDLSGGQKQRLMIARALIKNTDTFIFDEATSSLDTETEKTVMNRIIKYNAEKTFIIISHRYETISLCNKVIILNNGEVSFYGDIKNAPKTSSLYRELYAVK